MRARVRARAPTALGGVWTAAACASLGAWPAAAATGTPAPIPHALAGRDDCAACHGPSGVVPAPGDHAGRGADTCRACHQPPERAPDVAGKPTNEVCLGCHSSRSLSLALVSGEVMPLFVDGERAANDVHGRAGIGCTDCHLDFAPGKHPAVHARDRRGYALEYYTRCRHCHETQYTGTLDSMHALVLASGNRNAPVCTDCHTTHDVGNPHQPRSRVSNACGRCHSTIVDAYRASVHGAALYRESNPDVPVCSDCHGVHSIHDPRTARFRLESPELCGKCHRNGTLMSRYGISTDVFETYVADFHGTTVELFERQTPDAPSNKAVCYDCHGIHDIRSVDDPDSHVMKENLIVTCRRCHPNADPSFVGSWLGHYRPSMDRYPIVYIVQVFYRTLIPVVVGGMLLLVLLDAGRRIRDRFARSRDGGKHDA